MEDLPKQLKPPTKEELVEFPEDGFTDDDSDPFTELISDAEMAELTDDFDDLFGGDDAFDSDDDPFGAGSIETEVGMNDSEEEKAKKHAEGTAKEVAGTDDMFEGVDLGFFLFHHFIG